MHISENCYLCENLVFLDALKNSGYYCKVTGQKYCSDDSEEHCCSNYCQLNEE